MTFLSWGLGVTASVGSFFFGNYIQMSTDLRLVKQDVEHLRKDVTDIKAIIYVPVWKKTSDASQSVSEILMVATEHNMMEAESVNAEVDVLSLK